MQDYRQLNNSIRPSVPVPVRRRVYGGLGRPWLNQAQPEPEPAAVVGLLQPGSGDEEDEGVVVEERRCVRAPPLPPNGVRRSDPSPDEAFVERQVVERRRRRGYLDLDPDTAAADPFADRVASALVAHSIPARARYSPYSTGISF